MCTIFPAFTQKMCSDKYSEEHYICTKIVLVLMLIPEHQPNRQASVPISLENESAFQCYTPSQQYSTQKMVKLEYSGLSTVIYLILVES